MSERFYKFFLLEVPRTTPGSTLLAAGNGKSLHFRGYERFKVEVARKTFLHEVGQVQYLSVDFLLGKEVLRSHADNLQFASKGSKTISFGDVPCTLCRVNELLQEAHSCQVISQFGRLSPTFLQAFNVSSHAAIDLGSKPDCAVQITPDGNVEWIESKAGRCVE